MKTHIHISVISVRFQHAECYTFTTTKTVAVKHSLKGLSQEFLPRQPIKVFKIDICYHCNLKIPFCHQGGDLPTEGVSSGEQGIELNPQPNVTSREFEQKWVTLSGRQGPKNATKFCCLSISGYTILPYHTGNFCDNFFVIFKGRYLFAILENLSKPSHLIFRDFLFCLFVTA